MFINGHIEKFSALVHWESVWASLQKCVQLDQIKIKQKEVGELEQKVKSREDMTKPEMRLEWKTYSEHL